jgi:hypothetical protein
MSMGTHKTFFNTLTARLLLISMAALPLLFGHVSADFSGNGNGIEGDPYQITSCDQFMEINDDLDAYYLIMDDLDCRYLGNDVMVGGTGAYAENNKPPAFSGYLDGGNHMITIAIAADVYAIGLVRRTSGATITNIHLSGSVSGEAAVFLNRIGALIGLTEGDTTVSQCSSYVDVDARNTSEETVWVGGLIGGDREGSSTINNCSVFGNIWGHVDWFGLGWIIGSVYFPVTISGSYVLGDIIGAGGIWWLIGSVDNWWVVIENSYVLGTVLWSSAVGWLIWASYGANISKSYVAGLVLGDQKIGGIIGEDRGDNLISDDVFWDLLDGVNSSHSIGNWDESFEWGTVDNSTWLATVLMKDIDSFLDAGWDITSASGYLNNGYPFLGWQIAEEDYIWYISTTILGCMDEDADNYDEDVTVDDASCTYPQEPTPPSYGGGGWSIIVTIDHCPDGDFSASYYDRECEGNTTIAKKVVQNLVVRWGNWSDTQIQRMINNLILLNNKIQAIDSVSTEMKSLFQTIVDGLKAHYNQ